MVFLVFAVYFLLFGNILFLLLLRLRTNILQANQILLGFVSFGTAPLLTGLIYYYSVFAFPGHSNPFYISIISCSYLIVLAFGRKSCGALFSFYKMVWGKFCDVSWRDFKVIFISIFVAISLIFIIGQSFFYPAVDDSAAYINQSKAMDYAKHDLQNDYLIRADANNELIYSSSIRPGLTSYYAATMLIDRQQLHTQSYYSYKLLTDFYYILLLALFLFSIKRLAGIKGKLHLLILFSAYLFFWILTRMAVFDAKEIIIFFLALLSLNILDLIVRSKNYKGVAPEVVLGIVAGLNIFINVHGIMIFAFLILLLLIFSKRPFWHRILRSCVVLGSALIFSAFDLWTMYSSILYAGLRSNKYADEFIRFFDRNNISRMWASIFHTQVATTGNTTTAVNTNSFSTADEVSKEVFHTSSLRDVYLKGKLQSFTNLGFYALRGWIVLITFIAYLRSIWKNNFSKLIFCFMVIYVLIIIDPLNINAHQNAIVLSGSPNYSGLMVFLGLTVACVYIMDLVKFITAFISRFRVFFALITFCILIFMMVAHQAIVSFLANNLHFIIAIQKNLDFYQHKINILSYSMMVLAIIFICFIFASYFLRKSIGIFISGLLLVSLIMPFFLFEVGKVDLASTLTHISSDNQYKLEHSFIGADYYHVYFAAQGVLPKGSMVVADNHNVFAYNNYFNMSMNTFDLLGKNKVYRISTICPSNSSVLLSQNDVMLCQLN